MEIQNRKDLKEYFFQTLLTKEERDIDEGENEKKPKSVILESNVPSYEKIFTAPQWNARKTEDEDLVHLTFRNEGEFFLDILDKRFWILHTIDSSQHMDNVLYDLIIKDNSRLDYVWLSSNFLQEIGKWGKETGFSLKFDNKFYEKEDEDIEHVSMRFWGGVAKDIFNDLRKNQKISQAVSLSRMEIKYAGNPDVDKFVKENISYQGKLTINKGNSIDHHFNMLSRIKTKYSAMVYKIEDEYRISYKKSEENVKLHGDYLLIKFPDYVKNLRVFMEVISSCKVPFRLWGIWKLKSNDFAKGSFVDLHSGHGLNIEATNEFMRIYLKEDSCGNVVTRLFTNLQLTLGSKLELYGGENDRIM